MNLRPLAALALFARAAEKLPQVLLATTIGMTAATLHAQTTRTWNSITDGNMATVGNWNPSGVPSTSTGDHMLFNGSSAQTALTFPGATFGGSPGVGNITFAAGQTDDMTINNSGAANSVFRLRDSVSSPSAFTVEAGAGAISWGTSGNSFFLNLTNASSGVGNIFTNNSVEPVTFGTLLTINAGSGINGRPTFTGSGDWIIDGPITTAIQHGVTKNGAGTLVLSNSANAYTGGTKINGGTVQLNHANAGRGAVEIGDATLALNAPATYAFTSVESLTGTSGTLAMLGAAGSYGNKPLIVNGTLTVSRSVGGSGTGSTTVTSGVLSGAGTLIIDNTNGGVSPSVTPQGRAFFSNAANTFNGTVQVQNGGNFLNGTLNPSYVAVDVGADSYFTLLTSGPTTTTIGTLTGSGTFTKNANVALATIAVNDGNFSGVIGQSLFSATGTVGLEKNSGGTLTLSNASTYSGGTTINGGVLQLDVANAAGSGSVQLGNATLRLNHDAATSSFSGLTSVTGTTGALDILGTAGTYIAKPITVDGTLTITRSTTGSGSTAISGGLAGAGTLIIGNTNGGAAPSAGAQGRATFSNGSTFDGSVQILSTGNFLNNTGTTSYTSLDIAAGGYATFVAGSSTVGTLAGGGEIIRNDAVNSTTTLIVGDGNFSGLIRGNNVVEPLLGRGFIALSKVSAGTLTLSGDNLYSGGTTISDGTLLANNSAGSATGTGAVNVDGGILGGTGSIGGVVNVNGTGTLKPGNSPGTLAIDNTLTLNSGSTFMVELGGTDPGDGSGFYSQANMTNAGASVVLNSDVALSASLFGGFTPTVGDTFYILTRADAGSFGSSNFDGLSEGSIFNLGGYQAQITYQANWTGTQAGSALTGGNDVALTIVPEPSSLAMLAFGMISLWLFRRKK